MTSVGWVLIALGCRQAPPSAPPRKPDVLVVILDTVRADALSSYGNPRPTMNFDLVAQRGARFLDVTASSPWTWPSHASLFTGLYPWEHGARRVAEGGIVFAPLRFAPLRPDVPTLAERFRAAGYRTILHSANVLVGPQFPSLVRGFDKVGYGETDADVVEATLEALDDPAPTFVVVNLYGAHAPYTTHDEAHRAALASAPAWLAPWIAGDGIELQKHGKNGEPTLMTTLLRRALVPDAAGLALLRATYDGEVAALDLYVGVLATKLFARAPDPIVAVVADHGEAFGEHGFVGHGLTVYPEVLRVPLAILAPGRIAVGLVVQAPLQLQDLFVGLQELAGIALGEGALAKALGGHAIAAPIRAMAEPDDYEARVSNRPELGETWMLYREGRWAAIAGDATAELYDLESDPGMRAPLSVIPPEAEHVLAGARARPVFATAPRAIDTPDGATVERLQALGYVP